MKHKFELLAVAMFSVAAWGTANSQSDSADLAQELTNPIADLITLPIQVNFDNDIGPLDEGRQDTDQCTTGHSLQVECGLEPDHANDPAHHLPGRYLTGLRIRVRPGRHQPQPVLFPDRTCIRRVVWGVGPVFVLPTATDRLLGADKWGAGPAALALTMRGPWTLGYTGEPCLVVRRRQ